jgi:DNA mismatch endonuclease (patch repair protein)
MTDRHTPKQRSYNMSRIRSKSNVSTELAFAKLLRSNHIKGWRRHVAIEGRPDFVFSAQKLAVFVDGCFWHACKHCNQIPSSNNPYWNRKFELNRARDRKVSNSLRERGWIVLRLWEHSLKTPGRCIKRLKGALKAGGG